MKILKLGSYHCIFVYQNFVQLIYLSSKRYFFISFEEVYKNMFWAVRSSIKVSLPRYSHVMLGVQSKVICTLWLFSKFYSFTFLYLGLVKVKSCGENLLPCNPQSWNVKMQPMVICIRWFCFRNFNHLCCSSSFGKCNGDDFWLGLSHFKQEICMSSTKLSWSPVCGSAQHRLSVQEARRWVQQFTP